MGKRKNILIITFWSYKEALIQAYTLPYLYIIYDQLPLGSRIFLITLEQTGQKMSIDEKSQVKKMLLLKGIRLITIPYRKLNIFSVLYWILISIYLLLIIFFRSIKFIHSWCTPAGSIGYFLSVFSGRSLIIDSYEPHAEAMVENQTWKENGFQFKLLFFFEKLLSRRASIIISATKKMRDYALEKYGVLFKRFYVKPACVDTEKFCMVNRKNNELLRQFCFDKKIVCVYAGKFGGIYYTTEVFDFFKAAEDFWGDKFRVLLLTSHEKHEIQHWCTESGFDLNKLVIRFVPHADVPIYMGLGDFAISPVKPIPAKRYCTPIKDGEYWALGLPVVIPENISDDSDIIRENGIGSVMLNFDYSNCLTVVKEIDLLLKEKELTLLSEKIRSFAIRYRNFSIAENIYKEIYNN